MSPPRRALVAPLAALLVLGGCDAKNSGSYGCGISAVAGQSLLLEEFTRPGKTLSAPPSNIPGTLPVRVALGPALRAVAGRTDSVLVIGLEGALPPTPAVDWGILIVSPAGIVQGVLLYQGDPIQGSPRIGTINAGERNLPLVGLRTDIANFQDASCPVFPDSLTR
ncbi:MAG TPA: hypothetical protein VLB00_04715 [Gemmatimonadales bacterium]|nr:hypothetical protein [Gemmatimonadales bacterium]